MTLDIKITHSKYAPMPSFGLNPRLFSVAGNLRGTNAVVDIVTSSSNHGSSFRLTKGPFEDHSFHVVPYRIIETSKYTHAASIARIISWFVLDFKLFRYFRHMAPDVVVISSLSLTSIVFGIFLRWRHGSRLVFEVRDIWPRTMIEEGGFSRWHPPALYCLTSVPLGQI